MPNQVTSAGLQTKTLSEITASLVAALQSIYGADINVDQNSPDGQLINIFAQAAIDQLELLTDVYNSMAIESAYGTVLDQRVALNGMTRRAGTYTITPVTITVDRALTLTGLDALVATPTATVFTVSDDAGNQFYLVTTQTPITAGANVYNFRAKDVGAVQTTLNTITNQVTSILGVTTVNNPSVVTTQGVDEETDAQIKVRHAAIFKLASTGPSDAVRAAMLAVTDVADAYVVENETNATVGLIPAHSIWCIVNGGTDAVVAAAIYSKKAPGCGMVGATSVSVSRPQGNSMTIKFDRAVAEALYIQFSLVGNSSASAWDEDQVKSDLVAALSYTLNQTATIGDIIKALQTIVPQAYVTSPGVSASAGSYTDSLAPLTQQYYFTVAVARVDII